ncbi:MAG: HlyD family efflux transporter periplasmic adaptor subunit [Alphaproteobacteria bacterium]|nr:HlyD family efflux transporter periplasmic adaptor subunit [Alphaproteobacteria bacterium]
MKARHIVCTLILSVVLSGCGAPSGQTWLGYVEGEYVLLAAPGSGWLIEVNVENGQKVIEGDLLFVLESAQEQAAKDAAAARLAEANARLENLTKGRRAEELSVFDPQIGAAEANLRYASAEYARQQQLAKTDASARRNLEAARAAQRTAAAKLEELRLSRNVALLPARDDEIAAATALAEAGRAQLAEADWRLDQRRIKARVSGTVEDTMRRAGEFVPAGGAVVSLLPPQNVKLRFFVPETRLAELGLGKSVSAACDSCPAELTAKISFISSQAEFTPPVIYSRENRRKLVYLIEAKPSVPGTYLRPGLPVDIRIAP